MQMQNPAKPGVWDLDFIEELPTFEFFIIVDLQTCIYIVFELTVKAKKGVVE